MFIMAEAENLQLYTTFHCETCGQIRTSFWLIILEIQRTPLYSIICYKSFPCLKISKTFFVKILSFFIFFPFCHAMLFTLITTTAEEES